ncbi:RagB/SusD family protein [Mucilaginibacter sp. HMF5004]|uniref:RagB/SusD family protein n=1 Tax=Mucilaginibacter rivuli TaxID=2857527 RepID=UPI001C5DE298|nr:RagB/SusD family protein [Mucilaginibacter rivuli]MBW4889148.1 RagB/SusD family protein [Mucilaginibacter rivuli]
MKSNLQGKLALTMMMTSFLMLFSCKKALDIKPLSQVDYTQNYRNVTDANAAVLGIYGKFMGIAEQYIVLNELRADLMDVTPNADKYLQEISQHHVTVGNPWADPRPFYEIILNCNDVLYNLNIMLADNKISVADYNYRYSDIGAMRTWLYLQLGIHFGTIPYITDRLADVNAVNGLKDAAKYPRIPFDQLLDKLITFTKGLPWLEPYPNIITLINGSTATNPATPATVNGFPITKNFIDKHLVLGDLYLWQAAYNHPENYKLAATEYKKVLEYVQDGAGDNTYRMSFNDVGNNVFNDFCVDYTRYREQDINQLVSTSTQGWRSMFSRPVYPTLDTKLNSVWIWQIYFPQSTAPVDPFVDLFSPKGGRYLVQPSQPAIDNWNAQVQGGNANFSTTFYSDGRMRLTFNDPTGNYNKFNNQNVIMKNLYIYEDATVSQANKYGRWFLYRDATLNLRYAECANRDQTGPYNYGMLAYAILNNGINYNFNPYNFSLTSPVQNGNGPTPLLPGTTVNSVPTPPNGDYTNIEQTFYPDPYYIDARQGETPRYRNGWYKSPGIRGRASLTAYPRADMFDMIKQEDELLMEGGLEVAYEGHRWEDLLRIAIRRFQTTGNYRVLSDKVGDKLAKDGYGGAAIAQAKLQAGDFYLPFNW